MPPSRIEHQNAHPDVAIGIAESQALAAAGQTHAAATRLEALTRLVPEASAAHGYLAWALCEDHRHEEARVEAQAAVRLSPGSALASQILIHVLRKLDLIADARREISRFLSLKPSEEHEIARSELDDSERANG